MIVRHGLVLFPLIHRRATHQNDVLTRGWWRRPSRGKREDSEKTDKQETFHHRRREDYLSRVRCRATVAAIGDRRRPASTISATEVLPPRAPGLPMFAASGSGRTYRR